VYLVKVAGMFSWFKRKPVSPPEIDPRETLFGDMPLEEWLEMASDGAGWDLFAELKEHLDAGAEAEGLEVLKKIVLHPALEPRDYLQAWHILRGLGARPHLARAGTLYGIAVEVGLEEGLDVVAAYSDKTSRYYNFSGAGVTWGRPDASLDQEIEAFLAIGSELVAKTRPAAEARPPAPPSGHARISLLTPGGPHFVEGEFARLKADPLRGPALTAASNLVEAMLLRTGKLLS
jgi:hypothetical protein